MTIRLCDFGDELNRSTRSHWDNSYSVVLLECSALLIRFVILYCNSVSLILRIPFNAVFTRIHR